VTGKTKKHELKKSGEIMVKRILALSLLILVSTVAACGGEIGDGSQTLSNKMRGGPFIPPMPSSPIPGEYSKSCKSCSFSYMYPYWSMTCDCDIGSSPPYYEQHTVILNQSNCDVFKCQTCSIENYYGTLVCTDSAASTTPAL
jgi:hypothetical protein